MSSGLDFLSSLVDRLPLAPWADVFGQSKVYQAFFRSVAVLLAGYLLVLFTTPAASSQRQRAWILTFLSSGIMALGSLRYLAAFAIDASMNIATLPMQLSDFDVQMCAFFIAYLVLDLVVGLVHYRQYLNPLSGWIHHIGYMVLLTHLLKRGLTALFCLSAIMEVPTFCLSLGHLWKPMRHDLVFGFSFFLTRVVFHGFLVRMRSSFFSNFDAGL